MKHLIILLTAVITCFSQSIEAQELHEGITGKGTIGGGLEGRGIVYTPTIQDNSQRTGRVVVRICVNSKGEVISADYMQAGSTTADSELRNMAVRNAKKFKFSSRSIDRQCGTITIDFKVDTLRSYFGSASTSPIGIKDYEDSLIGKETAEEYLDESQSKFLAGDYKLALQLAIEAQKLASIDSTKAKALEFKGMIKVQLEDYRGAIVDFNEALEIAPYLYESFRLRGVSKVFLGKYEEGIVDLNKTLELKPDYAIGYLARGTEKINKYKHEKLAAISKGEKLDTIEKRLVALLDEGCLDYSKAGELGHFVAYDLIKERCN